MTIQGGIYFRGSTSGRNFDSRLEGRRGWFTIFHVFLGMIKETSKDKKWSIGSKESAAGQGKAIQSVIHLEW